jgi:hypothetical protein
MRGWLGAVRHLPEIRGAHRRLQRSARLRDVDLFSAQAHMDRGLLWSGVPELSREVIETCYLPLLAGGVGRRVPEMSGVMAGDRQ